MQIGYTFLPCVLAGLSNAPQYMVDQQARDCILASDVDSVILPLDACGGDGALAFANRKRNKVHNNVASSIRWSAAIFSVKYIYVGFCAATHYRSGREYNSSE